MGRLTLRLGVLGLLAAMVAAPAPAAAAAGWATFGSPTARSTYGTGIEFKQPVTVSKPVGRVELLLTVANAIGPTVVQLPAPAGTGPTTLSHLLDTSGDGHLMPNTPLVARWRLVAADAPNDVALGPELRITYADDGFSWQTEAGSLVRVHWYDGSAEFGRRALKIGEDGVRKASDLLGVTESKPVDFYVYADQQAFYDALGPGTRENVGGEADASIRTLFALIPPSQIDDAWVGIVIPHELTHLVIDTAAGNPYHFLPRWLNEGLAVYESQGYDASDRGLVSDAVRSGALIPLDGLVGEFPTGEGFFLAYAESVSAVAFMVKTYGSDALVKTIRSYKDGRTDDEAFGEGLGVSVADFATAWLADLGATAPSRYGPRPAPAGPVPSAWLAGGGAPAPKASAVAGPSLAPSAGPAAPAPAADAGGDAVVAILALLGIGVGLLAGVVVRRGRHDRDRPDRGPGV